MRRFLLIAAAFLMPLTTQAGALDWANGEWALGVDTDKDLNPQFRCGKETVKVKMQGNVYTYWWDEEKNTKKAEILSSSETSLKIQYEDEDRLMADGEIQIWNMVFIDEDHFVWAREDWLVDGKVKGTTSVRVRCEHAGVS